MKKLLIIPLLLTSLYSWEFTVKDLKNLTSTQKEILKAGYEVGSKKNLGYTIAATGIVETRLMKYHRTKNNICGAFQVTLKYLRKFTNVHGTDAEICKVLKTNHYASARASLIFYEYWLNRSKGNWQKAVIGYNKGNLNDSHGELVYLPRIQKVYKVLKENEHLWLD